MIKVGKIKLNKRSLKYGSNSVILIIAVVTIAIIINLLVGMGGFKWDLTSDKIYSLSNESKTILKDIKKEVIIYGLFDNATIPAGNAYKDLINLLDEYQDAGIKVKYIDPDKDYGTITSLDPNKTKGIVKGDFVVKSGNKVKKLDPVALYGEESENGRLYRAEPLITGAIKFVAADVTPIAYFVDGHGEFSLTNDLTQLKGVLENNNLEVKPLSLVSEDKVPADCKLLVFASPKKDLTEDEKIKVNEYFKHYGKAVFLFDPVETDVKFVNFEEVLAAFNVGINYDKVKELDSNRHLPQDEYAIISLLESNEINDPFNGNDFAVLLPDSRSLTILKNAKDWLKTTSLMKTSEKGVSSSIAGATEEGAFDLAIASEISGASKVLVFGNGKFLTDSALQSQYSTYFANGANYFLTTIVNWMQDKTNEETVSSKVITKKPLTTTAEQAKTFSILLIGVLPILIMGCGLFVWSRRRHL